MVMVSYRFVSDPHQAVVYLRSLSCESRLAVDVEADSLYSHPEKVCLIQMSTAAENVVLDVLAVGDALDSLGELLADGAVTKVFHGGGFDIRMLKKAYGFGVRNVADTMLASQLTGRSSIGLSDLLDEAFGVQLQKKYQRANWSERPLEQEMLSYAALDTAYLLPLWNVLEAELEELGRLGWAKEEFELLEAVEPAPNRPPCWFDIKGAHRLQPRQRVSLQSLVELRDAVARSWDRPPFKVLGNEVLLGWAQHPPETGREVMDTPRASKGVLRRLLPRVLRTLQEAQRRSAKSCPQHEALRRPAMTTAQRQRVRRFKHVRAVEAERLGLEPGLLATSATLATLARAEPQQAPQTLRRVLKKWQLQVLGGPLLEAVGA